MIFDNLRQLNLDMIRAIDSGEQEIPAGGDPTARYGVALQYPNRVAYYAFPTPEQGGSLIAQLMAVLPEIMSAILWDRAYSRLIFECYSAEMAVIQEEEKPPRVTGYATAEDYAEIMRGVEERREKREEEERHRQAIRREFSEEITDPRDLETVLLEVAADENRAAPLHIPPGTNVQITFVKGDRP